MYKKITILLCVSFIVTTSLLSCGTEDDSQKYIKLGNYKEIQLEKQFVSEATEEEINQYIDEIKLRNAEEVEIKNEPAKEGDLVCIDFTAKLKGKAMEEISEENCMLTIGMIEIAEGLDRSIIGHSVGDCYEYTGLFLDDFYNVASYYNEEMAGKEAVFEIKVKSISRLKLPELNDEFVKIVSEKSKTVKEYREEVSKIIEEDGLKEIDMKTAIWHSVVQETKIEKYSEKELEAYIQRREKHYKTMAEDYGMTYEEFIEYEMGCSEKEFDNRIKKEAKDRLKEQMIVRAIAKKENINVNNKDENLLQEAAWENDCLDSQQLKKMMSEEELQDALLLQRVKTWLAEHSQIK